MKHILSRKDLTSTSKVFYMALHNNMIPRLASQQELAKALGVTTRAINDSARQLEENGYITVDRHTYKKNFYNLVECPTSRSEQEEMEAYRKEVTASPEAAKEALKRIGLLPKN